MLPCLGAVACLCMHPVVRGVYDVRTGHLLRITREGWPLRSGLAACVYASERIAQDGARGSSEAESGLAIRAAEVNTLRMMTSPRISRWYIHAG